MRDPPNFLFQETTTLSVFWCFGDWNWVRHRPSSFSAWVRGLHLRWWVRPFCKIMRMNPRIYEAPAPCQWNWALLQPPFHLPISLSFLIFQRITLCELFLVCVYCSWFRRIYLSVTTWNGISRYLDSQDIYLQCCLEESGFVLKEQFHNQQWGVTWTQ